MNTDTILDIDYDIVIQSGNEWRSNHAMYIGKYRSAEVESIEAGKHRITLLYNDGRIHDTGYINQSEKAEGILRNWVLYAEQNSHLYKIDDLVTWQKWEPTA
jgi:hypothetical protein